MGLHHLTTLLVLLASAAYGDEDTEWFFSSPQCEVGQVNPTASGTDDVLGTIQINLVFQCSGQLDRWEFCTQSAGMVFLAVWRKVPNMVTVGNMDKELGNFQLRGANKISVAGAGCHMVNIPVNERLFVTFGDVIGIFYDINQAAILTLTDNQMEYRELAMTSDQLYRVNPAPTVPISGTTSTGQPSVSARIIGANSNLRLAPPDEYRMGRAEVMMSGNIWGSICDRWVDLDGWPGTFCRQRGFPTSERIAYTRDLPARFQAAPGVPIMLNSPNLCKPSSNMFIPNCNEHPNGSCTHDIDVFIQCEPKVRCRPDTFPPNMTQEVVDGNKVERLTCVPQIFIAGCWGHFCDETPPHFHVSAGLGDTWLSGFCRELGYRSGAVGVQYATLMFPDYFQDLDILSFTPNCTVKPPQIIDHCPPGIQNTACDHTCDFLVTCQRPAGTAPLDVPEIRQKLRRNDPPNPVNF